MPSPSDETNAGRAVLAEDPDSPGSLGIAISEAVEDAATREDTAYSLGSVLNHVLLHQTVIGQEALVQMEMAGEFPDAVVGCVGGGSNFAGLAFPFIREKIAGREIEVLACEPAACPTLTRGPFAYDFGDTKQLTPLVPMHTLGHDFVPPGIHAGGLRYHGVAPLISQLVLDGLVRAEAYMQNDVFGAAVQFARTEGIIPAPESAHAIHGAIELARRADEERSRADDPLQPLRPRALRPRRLRRLPDRQARGLRAARGRDRPRAAGDRAAPEAGRRHRLTHIERACVAPPSRVCPSRIGADPHRVTRCKRPCVAPLPWVLSPGVWGLTQAVDPEPRPRAPRFGTAPLGYALRGEPHRACIESLCVGQSR